LIDVLRQDNYKNLIPSASILEEAINYIKKLYGTTEEANYLIAEAQRIINLING